MTRVNSTVTHYAVQKFDVPTKTWRTINGTIKVASYLKAGRTEEQSHDLARLEAERQVSGWMSAYPLREFRVHPTEARSW